MSLREAQQDWPARVTSPAPQSKIWKPVEKSLAPRQAGERGSSMPATPRSKGHCCPSPAGELRRGHPQEMDYDNHLCTVIWRSDTHSSTFPFLLCILCGFCASFLPWSIVAVRWGEEGGESLLSPCLLQELLHEPKGVCTRAGICWGTRCPSPLLADPPLPPSAHMTSTDGYLGAPHLV